MARVASAGRAPTRSGVVVSPWSAGRRSDLSPPPRSSRWPASVSDRFGDPEEQVAYESVVQSSPEVFSAPAQIIMASDKSGQRDAALQYVLSY